MYQNVFFPLVDKKIFEYKHGAVEYVIHADRRSFFMKEQIKRAEKNLFARGTVFEAYIHIYIANIFKIRSIDYYNAPYS